MQIGRLVAKNIYSQIITITVTKSVMETAAKVAHINGVINVILCTK